MSCFSAYNKCELLNILGGNTHRAGWLCEASGILDFPVYSSSIMHLPVLVDVIISRERESFEPTIFALIASCSF